MESVRLLLNAILLSLVMVCGSIPLPSIAGTAVPDNHDEAVVWVVSAQGNHASAEHGKEDDHPVLLPKINQAVQGFSCQLVQQVVLLFLFDKPLIIAPVQPFRQEFISPPEAQVLFRHFISRQAP